MSLRAALPLAALLLLGALASLLVGPAQLSLSEVLGGIRGRGDADTVAIMQGIRLPRTLGALGVGAGLGASGAALQGFTRNDLAAPGLLGFSACAALGAVIALYFNQSVWIVPAALLGATLGASVTAALAWRRIGAGGLILAGIGVGALATALTGLAMNLAPNPWALSELTYWLMGSLDGIDRPALLTLLPLTGLGIALLAISGRGLRALGLGEDVARSMGVDLAKLQALVVVGTALCVGAGVAVAGAIGFVGLFVPHMVRRLTGPDPATLVLRSAAAGALFLLVTDTGARLLAGPGQPLYLGIVTALIGVPFFLYLAVGRSS